MKKIGALSFLIAVAASCACAADAPTTQSFGSDWPQFCGPDQNSISPEKGLLREWPEGGPKVLWKAKISQGWGCPSVMGDDVVYAGTVWATGDWNQSDKENIVCLDGKTGKEKWNYTYEIGGHYQQWYVGWHNGGVRATPAITEKYIYSISMIGTLRCLDRTTGKVVWEKDLGKEYWPFLAEKKYHEWKGTNFSPIVADGVVLAVFHAGFPNAGRGCVAFDAETGKQKWIFEEGKDVKGSPGDTPILVTLDKDRCAILTANNDKTLLAVRLSDGKKVWDSPIASADFDSAPFPKGFTYSPRTGAEGFVRSGDALYGFVSTTADLANKIAKATFRMTCVDRKTGKVFWNQEGFKSAVSLITADDLLFARSFQSLYLVEATTKGYVLKGKVEKMFEGKSDWGADGGWVLPVLSRGKLYIRTPSELICFKVSKD